MDGHVYWVEMWGTARGELDPKTGKRNRYPSPSGAQSHAAWPDSKGRIWYPTAYGPSQVVGMFDTKTKKIMEWDAAPDYKAESGYGITVDQKDRVWATASSASILVDFNPKTAKWTTHSPPKYRLDGSAAAVGSAPRQVAFDSKGKIWFTMTTANAAGKYDPDTGEYKIYTVPLRYARR